MKQSIWIIVFLVMSLTAVAQSDQISVPSWFGDNAVIERFEEPKGIFGTPRYTLFSVFSQTSETLEIASTLWPGKRFVMDKSKLQTKPGWTGWDFNSRGLSADQRELLLGGVAFDLSISYRLREGKSHRVFHLTNLVMGNVWLLFVDPENDSYEMPELSSTAIRRVRVLPLGVDPWSAKPGGWLPVSNEKLAALPLLCGLPRSFANAIAKQGYGSQSNNAIGLILVSSRLPFQSISNALDLFASKAAEMKQSDLDYKSFGHGVEAARESVKLVKTRYRQAEENSMARLTELKREGKVGSELPPPAIWRRFITGDQTNLPIRISGAIW